MRTPQFILPLAHELVIDLFAGGGGASTGIEQAIGRHVDIAVNHDAAAVSLHQANHPQTRHFVSDVFEVDPLAVTDGQPVGLLWASPDCFPAGTLVLTREGYAPIEQLQVGDEVMTHRARWRKVTETSSARRPLISIKGHGHPGLAVSPEHPFLARLRQNVWNNDRRSYDRTLQPRELYRAQGFPDTYQIDRGADGRALPKDAQVRMCGNSVCPPLAAALVRANYVEQAERIAA